MVQHTVVKKPGSPIKQFSVMLDNRVGSLSHLLSLLDSKGILCIGFCTHDCREAVIVRLITSDPEATALLFMENGIGFTMCDILVISLPEGAASLTQCINILYKGEINLNFAYSLLPCNKGFSRMALHVENTEFARKIFNTEGVSVLYQEDIIR